MSLFGILRILHVVVGIFVAGSYLFTELIMGPRLKKLGPAIESAVGSVLGPVLMPVHGISAVLLLGTGITMTLIVRPLSTLLSTGWGWVILIGLFATLGFMVFGFGIVIPAGIKLSKLASGIKGRPPTPEEGQQLHYLAGRIAKGTRANLIFVIIATAAMVATRYV